MADKIIYKNADLEHAIEIPRITKGQAIVFTHRAPNKESDNEDCTAVFSFKDDTSTILVIADGMGGSAGGGKASALAIDSIEASLMQKKQGSACREYILDGIDQANKAIAAMGIGAGTTLAVVEITNHSLRPYHIGDSAILIVGQQGKTKFYTLSHSPVGYAIEAGLLDEEEAIHHEERHVVSNMLGNQNMHIDIGTPISLARHDTVLLATDGLFDNFQLDEVIGIIRKGPLQDVSEKLIVETHQRMTSPEDTRVSKPDDISFILYRRTA